MRPDEALIALTSAAAREGVSLIKPSLAPHMVMGMRSPAGSVARMSLAQAAAKERAALDLLPPPVAPGDLAALYRVVQTFFVQKAKQALELNLPLAKQFKPLQNDVIWAYSSPRPPTKLNPELEGAALTLLSPFDEEHTTVPTLLATWLTRGGWPFVLQSVVKAFGTFTLAPETKWSLPESRTGLASSEGLPWVSPLGRLEAHLRSALAQATPAEQLAAREEALSLRHEASLSARSMLSCVFLDAQWLDADLTARVDSKRAAVFTGLSLLKAGDGARVAAYLATLRPEEFEFVSRQPFAHALLERFPDGAPLGALLERTVELLEERDPYQRLAPLALLRALTEVTKYALEQPSAVAGVVAALTKLQDDTFSKSDDPRPELVALLRAAPRLAAEPVKRAASKKAAWAVALAPQLERMAQAPATTVTADAGTFWLPAAFAPLKRRSGEALPADEVEALGPALRRRNAAHLARVKEQCTPASLAAFSWDLFSAWMAAGAPASGRWALQALGDFGDDEVARRLTPLIREWPGEKANQRARWGLEVLAAIGTDTALALLDGVAQRVKHRGIQDNARDLIGAIAARRGLSRAELSDRLVPDLGLDADGTKALSFGARVFRVGFDAKLKPFVTTESGKRLAELPKPNAKDDQMLAERSVEAWKALKRALKSEGPAIVQRFELALAHERRWSMDDFKTLILGQPLLRPLVRGLLWGTFGPDRKLREPFRVAANGMLEGVTGQPLDLAPDAKAIVGLVHPLRLTEAQAAVLADAFASELEVPFEQLNRRVFTLGPKEWESRGISRFEGRTTTVGKLFGLRERGWRLGHPQDAGHIGWLTRQLGDGTVAALHTDGFFVQGADPGEQVELGSIEFCDGLEVEEDYHPNLVSEQPVDTRSPVAISELLRDVEAISEPEEGLED